MKLTRIHQIHVSAPRTECPWLAQGWGFVMADGRIGTCCFDGAGVDGVLGTIWDNVSSFDVKPYSLCPECHHTYKERHVERSVIHQMRTKYGQRNTQ